METQEQAQSSGPALYKNVEPLSADQHSALRLKPFEDFGFARGMNSILLSSTEFPVAALNYPIVFAEVGGEMMPFAVTGYKDGENIYIGEDGQWRDNHYVPALVRRYPFIFMEDKEQDTLTLCIDAGCSALDQQEGQPLFEEGKPSALTEQALEFSKAYHVETSKTRQLCKEIGELGLFMSRNAKITLPDGETAMVSGFAVVDEQKFNELDDEAFLALRKSGALAAIYCHLISMRSWGNVLS